MQRTLRSPWILILIGIATLVIVLGVLWAVAPEGSRGLLLLAGGALTAAAYLVLYAVQRRRHWSP